MDVLTARFSSGLDSSRLLDLRAGDARLSPSCPIPLMSRTSRFTRPLLAASFAALPLSGHALDIVPIKNKNGQTAFEARFFGPGDGPFAVFDEGPGEYSTFTLSPEQKRKIVSGLELWAEIVTLRPGHVPPVLHIGTYDEANAGAMSPDAPVAGRDTLTTRLLAAMARDGGPEPNGHANIAVGRLDFDELEHVPSQLPRDPSRLDFSGVMFHELGHALGIHSGVQDDLEGSPTPRFGERLNQWSEHLRDDNGNPARAGQAIMCSQCDHPYSADAFDVRKDQGYFSGRHVDDVLAGAMPGLPVRMLSAGVLDEDYMSHIELRNSLMSHQDYRNYTNFMEAELAAMQDMGLQLDRRNFFGFSIYGDGLTLDNRNPYAARNAAGTAYVPGAYNTATLGLGLHIYGERNRVTQSADLLSAGDGGAGIRVDGSANTLAIAPGVRVHGNGWNGRGIMFSYGRDQVLIQRGDVQALGRDGIALAFDFGNNSMGSASEYRGSYIRETEVGPLPLLPELEGPLARRVDISGSVAGRRAAIYMSDNALVGEINVLRGASIQGDIVSLYGRVDEQGRQRLTSLNFGRQADAQGRALDAPDAGFTFRYDGNIQGIRNLRVGLAGGQTSLNGEHRLYSLDIAPGATLSGNSRYTMNDAGAFRNRGTLSPGNSFGSIAIAGNYVQESTGRLVLETNASGGRDTLTVSGLASVAGELHVALQPDWYADGWTVRSAELFQPARQEGDFDVLVASIASPTLLVDTRGDAGSPQGYAWSVMRGSDAYSQFARSGNGAALGRALGQASSGQQLPLRDLYRSLDFSRMDGADVATALEQLGPGAYGALTADAIQRDHRVGALLGTRGLFTALPATRPSGWRAFVQPYGYHATQDRREGLASHRTSETGVLVGLERNTRQDWTYGLNLSISELDSTSRSPHNGKGSSTAFQLGVHTRYQAAQDPRLHFAAYARAGAEQGRMKRGVGFSDYQASHDSDWNGASFNAGLATAYAWPLNRAVSVGPVLGLDYVHAYRPGVDESGPAASRLNLSSLKADSLQSSLGLMARSDWQLKNARRLQGYMAVTWEHEWLSRYATQQARFAASPGIAFGQRIAVGAPDAMGLRAGLDFAPQPNVAVRASVASRLFSPGQQDVGADVSVSWAF